ncbi:redoxin domain-containing protein [Maritimibacter harenae]|nr:redoxin domain-containing protein [Maritimibacter harenae]
MRIPQSFRRRVKWLPQIGDVFPEFHVNSTVGHLKFHDWAEGSWVLLLSHPAAHTAVCTTELGSIAVNWPEFQALGVKVLGLLTCWSDPEPSTALGESLRTTIRVTGWLCPPFSSA